MCFKDAKPPPLEEAAAEAASEAWFITQPGSLHVAVVVEVVVVVVVVEVVVVVVDAPFEVVVVAFVVEVVVAAVAVLVSNPYAI